MLYRSSARNHSCVSSWVRGLCHVWKTTFSSIIPLYSSALIFLLILLLDVPRVLVRQEEVGNKDSLSCSLLFVVVVLIFWYIYISFGSVASLGQGSTTDLSPQSQDVPSRDTSLSLKPSAHVSLFFFAYARVDMGTLATAWPHNHSQSFIFLHVHPREKPLEGERLETPAGSQLACSGQCF